MKMVKVEFICTSTEEMGGGGGNLIVYDKASGLFSGYGQSIKN